jgi:peptide/nickel transport system substrate-binding protein
MSKLEGRRGGTLRVLSLGQLDYLDPQRSYYMLGTETLRCLVRSLMTYPGYPAPEGTRIVPDLAESYPKISANGLQYTFRLKHGISFGPPLNRSITATDFKNAWERLLRPQTRGRAAIYLGDVVGASDLGQGRSAELAGVSCPDERTLVVELERPCHDLPWVMALPATSPAPKEVTDVHPDDYGAYLVASGPYQVADYDRGSHLLITRNPSWEPDTDPNRRAWVDAIDLRFNTPWERILAAIEQDDADIPAVVNPDPARVRRYAADPGFAGRWHVNPTNCARYIAMNTSVPPFDDRRVRQAVSFALDKAALAEVKGGQLAGRIATTILPPSLSGFADEDIYATPGHRGDPERARHLLAEAGFPAGFTSWCLVVNTGYGPSIGRVLRESLLRVGIDLDVRTETPTQYFAAVGNPRSTVPIAGSVGWCADWPGEGARSFLRPLFHSRSTEAEEMTNYSLYRNPEVDRLIEQAEETVGADASDRWRQVDRLIMSDAPFVPWLYDNHFDLVSTRLRNYFAHPYLVGADWANVWLEVNGTGAG